MVLCEHFIFTSANLKEKSGYQVISKSSKINSNLFDELEDYMYPLGLEPSKFSESKSMLVTDKEIIFTKAQNIGIGFDGRPDTTYSHTIIMTKDDFAKFQNDSRVFNELFVLKKEPGHLAPLVIEPKKNIPDFSCIDIIGIAQFKEFLLALIHKKRIAILGSYDESLIQSLLSLLSPSLRLISFSTMVVYPQRQPKFELIQTQSSKKSLEKYSIIDIKERKTIELSENTLFDQCVNYLLDIIDTKNSEKLIEIFDETEKIHHDNLREKFTLIIGTKLLDTKHPYLTNEKSLEELVSIIGNIPISISNHYWSKVKDFLTLEQHKRYASKFEIEQIINEHQQEEITLETVTSMFHSLQKNDFETREKLLDRLFQRREENIIKNGILLLRNANYSIYKNEIIDLFIKKEILNPVIFEMFDEQNKLTHIQKQSIYDELIKRSLPINSTVVLELLQKQIFDFTNEYETKHFRRLLEDVCESSFFLKEVDGGKLVQIINGLFEKLEDVVSYKPESDISRTTNNNLKQIRKIIKIFQKILDIIDNKESKEIQVLKNHLTSFLEKNQIQIKEEKPWWSWGWN